MSTINFIEFSHEQLSPNLRAMFDPEICRAWHRRAPNSNDGFADIDFRHGDTVGVLQSYITDIFPAVPIPNFVIARAPLPNDRAALDQLPKVWTVTLP